MRHQRAIRTGMTGTHVKEEIGNGRFLPDFAIHREAEVELAGVWNDLGDQRCMEGQD